MLKAIKASLAFMTPKERTRWYTLTGLRALLPLLDLGGVLAIGFVATSTAIFLTSGSDPNRVIEFAGLEIPTVNAQNLPGVAVSILALFLLKGILSVALMRKAAFFTAQVEARSARTIAETGFGGDLGDVRERSREELMFAIQSGSPSAFNTLLNSVNSFFAEAMLFALICIGFLIVDPWFTLVTILYFGLIASIMHLLVGSVMTRAGKINKKNTINANAALSDLLSVFRELLVLQKRSVYIEKIYRARLSAANSSATQYYLSGIPRYIIEAALLVGVSLFLLTQALSGDIVDAASKIGVFLAGGFRLTAALLPLQNSLLTINAIIPAARTAHDILGSVRATGRRISLEEEEQGQGKTHMNASPSESPRPIGLKLEAVSFSYPNAGQPALRNISFDVDPGTQVALMGPSGAGKSTIADLLCRVINPTQGSVIRINPKSGVFDSDWEGRVSYVPQRPGLVSGTILSNIALAEEPGRVDRARALKAIRLAHLEGLINQLPEGLDTSLGKLQDGLSGGQMQRLGLARALYTQPGLLVMDEATSALDAESEAEIQRALDAMRGKVTVVLIAHRLNTIQHADKVILVEDGQVKDSGTFQELIARNPSVERVVELMRVEED